MVQGVLPERGRGRPAGRVLSRQKHQRHHPDPRKSGNCRPPRRIR
jgi:hypothetical protein